MAIVSNITSTATTGGSLNSLTLITPSLTTTFTPQATTCTQNRLTMLVNRQYEIWMNMPVPVPGTTFTDCYPSQYMTSWLLSAGSITQPAFNPLVCPENYATIGPYTSNYIACCPSGYSFAQPRSTMFSDRPAFGGTCYTPILEGTPIIVTAYGSSGITATTTFSASVTNAQAYAYPIEGYAYGVAQVPSITAEATATASASAAATIYTVLAGTGPGFVQSFVNARIGDSILFMFESGNHTVTQSSFNQPCERLSGGLDSGYKPNIKETDADIPNYTINVTSLNSQWFFSEQSSECEYGMVFALNPSTAQPFSAFYQNALNTNSTSSSGISSHVKIGVSVGVIGCVAIIVAGLLYVYRRCYKRPAVTGICPEGGPDKSLTTMGTSDGSLSITRDRSRVSLKGAELHDQSMPGELSGTKDPVELDDGNCHKMYSEPTENLSPIDTIVSSLR